MITVAGKRRGMSYEESAENCAAFFNRVKSRAEDKSVTICLEVMNNKFTDPTLGRVDQICNQIDWAVDVVKRVNSPRIKVLFDIYHVQIMDGDLADHIRDNFQWIAHFHTGGVPGRHLIDDSQEINYRFVARSSQTWDSPATSPMNSTPRRGTTRLRSWRRRSRLCGCEGENGRSQLEQPEVSNIFIIAAVIRRERGIQRQRSRCNPSVLRTHWPACRTRLGPNPRPNRAEVIIGEKHFKALDEFFEHKAPLTTPTC